MSEKEVDVWKYPVLLDAPFKDASFDLKVDGSEWLEECPRCHGDRTVTCTECRGMGNVPCPECKGARTKPCPKCHETMRADCFLCLGASCTKCHGSGKVPCSCGTGRITCGKCSGLGNDTCNLCHGRRNIPCPECGGEGQFLRYIGVRFDYSCSQDERIVRKDGMHKQAVESADKADTARAVFQLTDIMLEENRLPEDTEFQPHRRELADLIGRRGESPLGNKMLQQQAVSYKTQVLEVSYAFEGQDCLAYLLGSKVKVVDIRSPIGEFTRDKLRKAGKDQNTRQFDDARDNLKQVLKMLPREDKAGRRKAKRMLNQCEKAILRPYWISSFLAAILISACICFYFNSDSFLLPAARHADDADFISDFRAELPASLLWAREGQADAMGPVAASILWSSGTLITALIVAGLCRGVLGFRMRSRALRWAIPFACVAMLAVLAFLTAAWWAYSRDGQALRLASLNNQEGGIAGGHIEIVADTAPEVTDTESPRAG